VIDFLVESEHPNYGITEEIRGLLLGVSASEADLLLKPARKAFEIRGKHYAVHPNTPVYFRFDTAEECDAVAMHCPAEVYRWLCQLLALPSFRLIAKEKQANGR
jgi:hypothetical protein